MTHSPYRAKQRASSSNGLTFLPIPGLPKLLLVIMSLQIGISLYYFILNIFFARVIISSSPQFQTTLALLSGSTMALCLLGIASGIGVLYRKQWGLMGSVTFLVIHLVQWASGLVRVTIDSYQTGAVLPVSQRVPSLWVFFLLVAVGYLFFNSAVAAAYAISPGRQRVVTGIGLVAAVGILTLSAVTVGSLL